MRYKSIDCRRLEDTINGNLNRYYSRLKKLQDEALKSEKQEFIQAVIEIIEDAELTNEAKDYLQQDISYTKLVIPDYITKINRKISEYRNGKYIKSEELYREIEKWLSIEFNESRIKFIQLFQDRMNKLLAEVKANISENKDNLFTIVQSIEIDKHAVLEFVDEIEDTVYKLNYLTDEFKEKIWYAK